MPGVIAPASCALAVGHAEQAASLSKAAGQVLVWTDGLTAMIPFGVMSTYLVEMIWSMIDLL